MIPPPPSRFNRTLILIALLLAVLRGSICPGQVTTSMTGRQIMGITNGTITQVLTGFGGTNPPQWRNATNVFGPAATNVSVANISATSNNLTGVISNQVLVLTNLVNTNVISPAAAAAAIASTGTNITNSIGLLGTNLTNTILVLGTNTTNSIAGLGTNLTNTILILGTNTSNFTRTIGTNLSNNLTLQGTAITNSILLVGTNLSNSIGTLGTNLSNSVAGQGTAITNTILVLGTNTSNFTRTIGTNLSNNLTLQGTTITNSILILGTNLSNSIGTLGTNLSNSVAGQGTAITNSILILGTNLSNSLAGNGTNLTNTILILGTNSSNFTRTIGTNLSNNLTLQGATITNSILFLGTNLSNSIGGLGTNLSNSLSLQGTTITNSILLLGTNSSNFTRTIGTNLSNNLTLQGTTITNSILLLGTNTSNSIATLGTNLSNSLAASGVNITNYVTNSVAILGTNLTNALAAQGVNITNTIRLTGTNTSNSIAGLGTNFTNAILILGTNLTNTLIQTNVPSYVLTNYETNVTTLDNDFHVGPDFSVTALNGNIAAGAISGSGSNIVNLNAGNLIYGTVPLARLPTNLVTNVVITNLGGPSNFLSGAVTSNIFYFTNTDGTNTVTNAIFTNLGGASNYTVGTISNHTLIITNFSSSGGSGDTVVVTNNTNSLVTLFATTNSSVIIISNAPTTNDSAAILGTNNGVTDVNQNWDSVVVGGNDDFIIGSYYTDGWYPWGVFIGGGQSNTVQTYDAGSYDNAIIGGNGNTISNHETAGSIGLIEEQDDAIAGGYENAIRNTTAGGHGVVYSSFVAAGYSNSIVANASIISNVAIIAGGLNLISNTSGTPVTNSAAGGYEATLTNSGSFLWNDGSAGPLSSSNNNTFTVHAAGGIVLVGGSLSLNGTNITPGAGGTVNSNAFILATNGVGFNSLYLTNTSGMAGFYLNGSVPGSFVAFGEGSQHFTLADQATNYGWLELWNNFNGYDQVRFWMTNGSTEFLHPVTNDSTVNTLGIETASSFVGPLVGAATSATNLLGGGTGNKLTNLNAFGTIATTNISSSSQSMGVGDGVGDGFEINDGAGIGTVGIFDSGNISGGTASDVTLDGNGGVQLHGQTVANDGLTVQGNGFQFIQDSGGASFITQDHSPGFQEGVDIAPDNFTSLHQSDLMVWSGNSNNYTAIIGTLAMLQCNGIWWNFTNITGQSTFMADMSDRRIFCNPVSTSCQIKLPALGIPHQIITATNIFGWTYTPAAVAGGNNLMPALATIDYVIENSGSNTANTLSVCTADHASFTNIGLTNLVVPNQTSVRLTTDGTNIFAEMTPMTANIGSGWGLNGANGAGVTNISATNLTGTIATNNLPGSLPNLSINNGGSLTNLNAANLVGTQAPGTESTNAVLLNSAQTITGTKTFSQSVTGNNGFNAGNSGVDSSNFYGNGSSIAFAIGKSATSRIDLFGLSTSNTVTTNFYGPNSIPYTNSVTATGIGSNGFAVFSGISSRATNYGGGNFAQTSTVVSNTSGRNMQFDLSATALTLVTFFSNNIANGTNTVTGIYSPVLQPGDYVTNSAGTVTVTGMR